MGNLEVPNQPPVGASQNADIAQDPMVSVIMPTYNRADYLPQTLDSLRAQTMQNYELLIIDDGSTDGTADLIRSRPEPIRYFWQENAGPAAARNRGLKEARGQLVAFLDSDDLWRPRFLEAMTDSLTHHPDLDVAFCKFETIDDQGRVLRGHYKKPHAGQITEPLFASTFITTPSVVARLQVIRNAGGLNPALLTNEDYDLWLRLSLHHRFGYVDEPLCLRRSHPGTQSRNGSPVPLIRKAQLLEGFLCEHGESAGIGTNLAHRRLAKVYRSAGKSSLRTHQYAQAREMFRRSLAYRPAAPRVWMRYLLAGLLGKTRRDQSPSLSNSSLQSVQSAKSAD